MQSLLKGTAKLPSQPRLEVLLKRFSKIKFITYLFIAGLLIFCGFSSLVNADGITDPDLDHQVYIPYVAKPGPQRPSPFGTEIFPVGQLDVVNLASDLDIKWVRAQMFFWKDIEPERQEPPVYLWETIDEDYLIELSTRGMTVIATIKFTPEWAQKVEGYICSPVAEHALDEYVQFVQAMVSRYSAPPYNVKYWEFGNEVDVDPMYVPSNSVIGCWGDEDEEYNGGEYYALMLQHVYPAIKAIDPSAKVLIGGLLMDCDPDPSASSGYTCRSGKFFEGILKNGGGDYFDIVSFHAYAFFYSGMIVDENFPTWANRGGVVLGKIDYLQEVMEQYGVSKQMMLTETGLRCPYYYAGNTSCSPPTDEFYERQADYVVWLYVRNWNTDAINTVWFPMNYTNWQYTELLYRGQLPKPAYYAYRFLARELGQAEFSRELPDFPELRAYEFSIDRKLIWVLWASDLQEHEISLPENVLQIYNKYGTLIEIPQDGTIAVDSPIYIELSP